MPDATPKLLGLGRPAAARTVVPTETLASPLPPEPPVFFPEIIAGLPLRLAPPAGPAKQPESERIEGPAPGRRIPANTAVTGAASRTVSSRSSFWTLRANSHGRVHKSFGRPANYFQAAATGMRRTICADLPSLAFWIIRDA